jgi:hypothetical protein
MMNDVFKRLVVTTAEGIYISGGSKWQMINCSCLKGGNSLSINQNLDNFFS